MSPENLSRRAIVAGVAVSAVAAPVIAGRRCSRINRARSDLRCD